MIRQGTIVLTLRSTINATAYTAQRTVAAVASSGMSRHVSHSGFARILCYKESLTPNLMTPQTVNSEDLPGDFEIPAPKPQALTEP